MRVKRHKKFQRYLSYFQRHFHFSAPYQIVIDGTFANAVLINKVHMKEQLPKFFDGDCNLQTTPCVLIETEKLGPSLYGAVQVLKGLQVYKCGHAANPIQASKCIKSVAKTNVPKKSAKTDVSPQPEDHFVVATQDGNLRSELREIIGIPLLYLHGNAPTMEKPSDASVKWAEKRSKRKLEISDFQKETLQRIKGEELPNTSEPLRKGTKKRKRAGPNPLSCKKSKKVKFDQVEISGKASSSNSDEQQLKKKRKRVKVRIPKHVRELTK